MTRHLHETANAVLYRALDLPAGDRQQYIAQATAGDLDLFEDVRTMLSRIEQLDQFLEDPFELPSEPRPAPLAAPRHGDLIDRWRVERELGRNGADLILLVRDESVRDESAANPRLATMRLAQTAARTGQTGARFERLRQRLATLAHPALPTPIDSGSTADGLPYFVLGRGAGLPIDRYCAEQALALPARAALFARICHAVHYMHQHLIVHRDLKPDDLLVDDTAGTPPAISVLDVGMIGEGWPLNPAYASPDQLAGQPLSVASDIYSLGAVLYGLVSGQLVHADDGFINARDRSGAARPASEAVLEALAAGRGMAPELPADPLLQPSAALADALRTRFDPILARALASDPAERFASAHALASALEALVDDPRDVSEEGDIGDDIVTDAHTAALAAAGDVAAADPVTPAIHSEPAPIDSSADSWPPRRTSAAPLALAMLAAGLIAGAIGGVLAAPWVQQQGWGKALTSGAAPASARTAAAKISAATAIPAASASRPGAGSDADKADALLRQGVSLGEQGRTDEALAALRSALALHEAHAAMGEGAAARPALATASATDPRADVQRAIATVLAGTGDDAGAESALNQARTIDGARLQQLPASADAAVRARLQAALVDTELARASAQNAQRHGRDTVATLANLRRLAGGRADPRIDLLEAYVQPRGTAAQAYAAAQPALAALKNANRDDGDAFQQRTLARALTMTGEIGLRAKQTSAACARLSEAAAVYATLAADKRAIAYDALAQQKLATARAGC